MSFSGWSADLGSSVLITHPVYPSVVCDLAPSSTGCFPICVEAEWGDHCGQCRELRVNRSTLTVVKSWLLQDACFLFSFIFFFSVEAFTFSWVLLPSLTSLSRTGCGSWLWLNDYWSCTRVYHLSSEERAWFCVLLLVFSHSACLSHVSSLLEKKVLARTIKGSLEPYTSTNNPLIIIESVASDLLILHRCILNNHHFSQNEPNTPITFY